MTQSTWIGKTLSDRYEIQELLGQGGMSAVYKANDPNLRRVVAVKIIHEHLSRDPEFVRRFEEEAAAVATLRHPNLIQVYDFNHDEETYYIVFEFVPGESVQERLKRMKTASRPMDIDEAVEIVAQAADGLQYAHTKGLIHRDIKPANIMLNVTGDPIIMDFGIAKIMGGTQHTATGAVLGTARYMSPEQIKGERIDPRTDIYSLGITLFEMLGGRPPFEADSAMTLMMMHMTDPVPRLQDLRADVPPNLVAIVNKSLAKNGDDRYQTAAEFAVALRNMGQSPALPLAAATVFESTVPDPEVTVLEPVTADPAPSTGTGTGTGNAAAAAAAAAVVATTGATGATGAAATGATGATPPPPPTTGAYPPAAEDSGGSRTVLYAVGGIVLLLVIAIGVWAIFLRDSGGDDVAGGGDVPTAVVETPDSQATIDAGVAAELETRAAIAAQTAEAIPTNTPPPGATNTPIPEATATDAPVIESAAVVDKVEGDVVMITPGGEQIKVTADTPIVEGSQFITGADGELTFTMEDDTIVQLLTESDLFLVDVGNDPDAVNQQQTNFALVKGDVLLRQPDPGNELAVWDEGGNYLIGTLLYPDTSSAAPKRDIAAKRTQQEAADEVAMSVHVDEDVRVIISCFAGVCSAGDGTLVRPGWERVVSPNGAFISSFPITTASLSYQRWQEACDNCLPEADEDPVNPSTATAEAPPEATPVPPTWTPVPPTRAPEATPTAAATEPASYSAQITDIGIDGNFTNYVVSYVTNGYTEQLPGQHVHFYFDTVSEANAGLPGSGPWKVYGGPRPFTQYTVNDRGAANYMCILSANPDHSIIPGSGNCFPLPETSTP